MDRRYPEPETERPRKEVLRGIGAGMMHATAIGHGIDYADQGDVKAEGQLSVIIERFRSYRTDLHNKLVMLTGMLDAMVGHEPAVERKDRAITNAKECLLSSLCQEAEAISHSLDELGQQLKRLERLI